MEKDFIVTPILIAIAMAIYAYYELSAKGILYPNLQLGVFFAAFIAFAIAFIITFVGHLVRHY